jgi:pimeloyl-ACP methyl ester carboxylesterase
MWWAIGCSTGALILFFALLYIIYHIVFSARRKKQRNIYDLPREVNTPEIREKILWFITELNALPYEQVCITSRDGLTLYGKYYHNKDGAPLDICFHGYRGTDIRDLSGCLTTINNGERNVLLVSQRCGGKSSGRSITFGVKERYDCLAWINYAIDRFGKGVRILLRGVSMGASTVLYACGLDLPNNVYGVLADCPYDSPSDIIKKVCKNERKLPPKLVYPLIWLSAGIFASVNIGKLYASEQIKKSKVPVIVFHGEKDAFVPAYMSERIANARDNVERHVFNDAGHGLCYMYDTERYEKLLGDFIDRNCPKT